MPEESESGCRGGGVVIYPGLGRLDRGTSFLVPEESTRERGGCSRRANVRVSAMLTGFFKRVRS